MSHDHYKRDVSNLKVIDVYRIIELFEITCPVAQHVLKKSMAAGKRGHKGLRKDWQDIIDSGMRKLQMLDEDAVAWPTDAERKRAEIVAQNGNDGAVYDEPCFKCGHLYNHLLLGRNGCPECKE